MNRINEIILRYNNKDIYKSRFFKVDDPIIKQLGSQKLPTSWWSRIYEYKWAIDVASDYFKNINNKICLDAGCGVEHPFKYGLTKYFDKVIGVDSNTRIYEARVENPKLELYCSKTENFKYFRKLDCIFCISVLEHCKNSIIKKILKNFYSLLVKNGCIILTFDYPRVNLHKMRLYIEENKFSIIDWDESKPKNILNGANSIHPMETYNHLNVFRVFAIKKESK